MCALIRISAEVINLNIKKLLALGMVVSVMVTACGSGADGSVGGGANLTEVYLVVNWFTELRQRMGN